MELVAIILVAFVYGHIGGIIFTDVMAQALRSSGREFGLAFLKFVVLSQTWPVSMWFYRN